MPSTDVSESHYVHQGCEQQLSSLLDQEKTPLFGHHQGEGEKRPVYPGHEACAGPVTSITVPSPPSTPFLGSAFWDTKNKDSSSESSQSTGGTKEWTEDSLMHLELLVQWKQSCFSGACLYQHQLLMLLLSVTSESEGLSIPNFLLQWAVSRLQFD